MMMSEKSDAASYDGYECSILVLGAPGLGKSTFASSIAEIVPPEEVLLLVAKPGEEKSFGYRRHGLVERAELFHDLKWRPSLEMYEAGAYRQLLRRLYDLQDDEQYGAVIIDPITDVFKLLEHEILAPMGVGSPGDLGDAFGFYRQLADGAEEFVTTANVLTTSLVARPKWVIMPQHTQPPKEAPAQKVAPGQYAKSKSGDEKAKGVEYEGNVLPMLEGSYRRKLAGDVSLVVYCDIESKKAMSGGKMTESAEYVVQVVPNSEKHAKVRISPGLASAVLPNDMGALMAAVQEAERGEG